jgi:hypothetical protein
MDVVLKEDLHGGKVNYHLKILSVVSELWLLQPKWLKLAAGDALKPIASPSTIWTKSIHPFHLFSNCFFYSQFLLLWAIQNWC